MSAHETPDLADSVAQTAAEVVALRQQTDDMQQQVAAAERTLAGLLAAPPTPTPAVVDSPPVVVQAPDTLTVEERTKNSAKSRAIRSAIWGCSFAVLVAVWGVISTLTNLPGTQAEWWGLGLVLVQTAWSSAWAYFGRKVVIPKYDRPTEPTESAPEPSAPVDIDGPSGTA